MAGLRCMLMRGGTSKAAYFLATDLPAERDERDALLLRIMGSPDPRQIDGIGGADPLTSKVAVVGPSQDPRADIDYLFLQVGVGEASVVDAQNCGNVLSGVGPFAVERGLLDVTSGDAEVRIRQVNSNTIVRSRFAVRDGEPVYDGDASIAGVPGTAAPIYLEFEPSPESAGGRLLPTGRSCDDIGGVRVTCVDGGMPVVVTHASAFGLTGYESPGDLSSRPDVVAAVEALRIAAGAAMGLGDVTALTVPKVTLVAPPVTGGDLCTRTHTSRNWHDAIGALGAVSVAAAALLADGVATEVLGQPITDSRVRVEHPQGVLDVVLDTEERDGRLVMRRSRIVRTARRLFDGVVYPR